MKPIWLCADDYGISPGVNRAIRELIERGRLNATSVMMVTPAIGRDEVARLTEATVPVKFGNPGMGNPGSCWYRPVRTATGRL